MKALNAIVTVAVAITSPASIATAQTYTLQECIADCNAAYSAKVGECSDRWGDWRFEFQYCEYWASQDLDQCLQYSCNYDYTSISDLKFKVERARRHEQGVG